MYSRVDRGLGPGIQQAILLKYILVCSTENSYEETVLILYKLGGPLGPPSTNRYRGRGRYTFSFVF